MCLVKDALLTLNPGCRWACGRFCWACGRLLTYNACGRFCGLLRAFAGLVGAWALVRALFCFLLGLWALVGAFAGLVFVGTFGRSWALAGLVGAFALLLFLGLWALWALVGACAPVFGALLLGLVGAGFVGLVGAWWVVLRAPRFSWACGC